MKLLTTLAAFVLSTASVLALPTDNSLGVNTVSEVTANPASILSKRDDYWSICDGELEVAQCGVIQAGMWYLEKKGSISFAPKKRGRVSCSYNTGIYVENTSNNWITISGKEITNQIKRMYGQCQRQDCEVRYDDYFRGKIVYPDHVVYVTGTHVFGEKC